MDSSLGKSHLVVKGSLTPGLCHTGLPMLRTEFYTASGAQYWWYRTSCWSVDAILVTVPHHTEGPLIPPHDNTFDSRVITSAIIMCDCTARSGVITSTTWYKWYACSKLRSRGKRSKADTLSGFQPVIPWRKGDITCHKTIHQNQCPVQYHNCI